MAERLASGFLKIFDKETLGNWANGGEEMAQVFCLEGVYFASAFVLFSGVAEGMLKLSAWLARMRKMGRL